MSLAAVRRALETALNAISPALSTAWQNAKFTPVNGTPWQEVFMLPAPPENIEIGPGYTERGIMQVNLFYPLDKGAGDAEDRAALIRAAFPFGSTFTADGVTTLITGTPEISPARAEGDQFMVPVRVTYSAYIGG